MAKEKHVHKLKKHSFKSGNQVFFCALPDCHCKFAPALVLGKRCICWRCGEEFIMNEYSLRLTKPHCTNCHKPKVIKVTMTDVGFNADNHKSIDEPIPDSELTLAERLNKVLHPADDGDI